jgi:hypothetical protein
MCARSTSAHTHHGHACCLQSVALSILVTASFYKKFVLLTCPCWPLSLSIRHSAFFRCPYTYHRKLRSNRTEPLPLSRSLRSVCPPTSPRVRCHQWHRLLYHRMVSHVFILQPNQIGYESAIDMRTACGSTRNSERCWLLSKWPLVASGNDDDPICEYGSLRNIMRSMPYPIAQAQGKNHGLGRAAAYMFISCFALGPLCGQY